jgi:hypothetical protein
MSGPGLVPECSIFGHDLGTAAKFLGYGEMNTAMALSVSPIAPTIFQSIQESFSMMKREYRIS